jgi:hypothetical protein
MKKRKSLIERSVLLGLVLVFAGCGGGDGGGNSDPTGVFLDSAVSGLTATSADRVSITDANGRFTYLNGTVVMFAIGDTVIGLGRGKAIMTPLDLVDGAVDETDEEVTNIARFLQTLDLDQTPSNGIVIDASVRAAAAGVMMNFGQSIAGFETNEQANVALLTAGLPGGPRPLVSALAAQEHLENTVNNLQIAVAGRYDGTFSATLQ